MRVSKSIKNEEDWGVNPPKMIEGGSGAINQGDVVGP